MEIYQIKVINGGFKGLEVSYIEHRTEPNGRKFIDDVTKEKNDPIHLALDKLIKELRIYLLDICGNIYHKMDQAEIDYAVSETEIVSIEMKKTFFVIKGEKEWLNNKKFTLKTPKVEKKDNDPNTDKIVAILEDIRKETEIYMKGTAKLTDEEIAVRWLSSSKNKTGIQPDDFNNMSIEERAQWCKEWLEKEVGGMVTLQTDLDTTTDDQEEEQTIDLNEKEEAEF